MPKFFLLLIALAVVIITVIVTLLLNSNSQEISRSEIDTAVNQAKHEYNQRKAKGEDFSKGPCLSNALMPGWVVDIAHSSPRLLVDDLPENQCSAYREGTAKHFVELDPEGNLIRAK